MPLAPEKLFCDAMLARLGRWLRAAGYDTAIAEPGLADPDLVARARLDRRRIVTRDRALARQAGALLLTNGPLAAQAAELKRALGIDWLQAPFTRCLIDNRGLVAPAPADWPRLPEKARLLGGSIRLCPDCGRLYWPGSHVRRMQARLVEWAKAG